MELEINCERCKGKGRIENPNSDRRWDVRCPVCLDGKVATEFGDEVINFVTKWLLHDLSNRIERAEDNIKHLEVQQ